MEKIREDRDKWKPRKISPNRDKPHHGGLTCMDVESYAVSMFHTAEGTLHREWKPVDTSLQAHSFNLRTTSDHDVKKLRKLKTRTRVFGTPPLGHINLQNDKEKQGDNSGAMFVDHVKNIEGIMKGTDYLQNASQQSVVDQQAICILGKKTSFLEAARRGLENFAFLHKSSYEIRTSRVGAVSVSEDDLQEAALVILLGVPEPRGLFLSTSQPSQLGRAYQVALNANRKVMMILVIETDEIIGDSQVVHPSFLSKLNHQLELLELYYNRQVITVTFDEYRSNQLTFTHAQENLLEKWERSALHHYQQKLVFDEYRRKPVLSNSSEGQLDSGRKLIIHLSRNKLQKRLNLTGSGLLYFLQHNQVLTDSEVINIKFAGTNAQQVDMLLDYIEQKTNMEFDRLCGALETFSISHIYEDLLSHSVIDDHLIALTEKIQRHLDLYLGDQYSTQMDLYIHNIPGNKTNIYRHYTVLFEGEYKEVYRRVCMKEIHPFIHRSIAAKIVSDWILATSSRDETKSHIEILRQFKLILPINIHLVQPHTSVMSVLQNQLNFFSSNDMNVIEWLVKEEPERVLLLLDGLDDYVVGKSSQVHKVMQGVIYNECFVVVTSGEVGLHTLRDWHIKIPVVETKLLKHSDKKGERYTVERSAELSGLKKCESKPERELETP